LTDGLACAGCPREIPILFADRAAQYIEATPAVQVEPWDRDGRQGGQDLRCEYRSRSVAVEVKCVLDQDYRQMQGETDKKEYRPYERLSRLWDSASATAHISRVAMSCRICSSSWTRSAGTADCGQLQREFPGVAARLQALGGGGLIPLRPTEAHPPG
jgi:hypothetical protein